MATLHFNPPLVADLSAFLAEKGVVIPNASIKIYSAYHYGVSQKKLTYGKLYFILGENGWSNQTEYGNALRNYAEAPEDAFARDYWHYNMCSQAAMREIERQTNVST